jgi:hypothetical protein
MQKDNLQYLKNNTKLSTKDETFLREKFIIDYTKQKGWDKENLSPTQMLEIAQQPGYKNPGMILS